MRFQITAAVVTLAILIGTAGITIDLLRAIRAEKKAVEEAATAKRVSDFLVALFMVSDPRAFQLALRLH